MCSGGVGGKVKLRERKNVPKVALVTYNFSSSVPWEIWPYFLLQVLWMSFFSLDSLEEICVFISNTSKGMYNIITL